MTHQTDAKMALEKIMDELKFMEETASKTIGDETPMAKYDFGHFVKQCASRIKRHIAALEAHTDTPDAKAIADEICKNAWQKTLDDDDKRCSDLVKTDNAGGGDDWLPMETSPMGTGEPVLLKFKDDLSEYERSDKEWCGRWQGLQFVGRSASKNHDLMGWQFAAPVGHGGIPNAWLEGWKPLNRPASPPDGFALPENIRIIPWEEGINGVSFELGGKSYAFALPQSGE